jgi:HK97 family phage major capsid protein
MSGVESSIIGQHGSIGQLVRSMSTSSGSALVPTVWASDIIDRARNFAAVLQAGAEIVPMDAKVVQIGRLTADPTAAFRTEGSTITASDPTFDNVTLTATTQSALVVGSLEWFQDASNVDEIVSNAIAKAIGLNLDLVGLYGSITTGAGSINLATPPNPRGILGALNATAATSVLPSSGAATNGTTQTVGSFWNEILDTVYTPADFNEQPNALIWNSKAARMYAKVYDTTGQPLRRPAALDGVQTYVSNQIPSYTQGTMTSVATDVFCGDFTQLLIGQRLELHIQTLTERYAELGQVGIVANWRGDVGVARSRAFSVYKAIKGA